VAYVPGTAFYADGLGSRSMRLSYCYPSPDRIREGIRRLSQVVEQELELHETFGPSRPSARFGLDGPAPDLS
jgi:2-aminoadipate transaminase